VDKLITAKNVQSSHGYKNTVLAYSSDDEIRIVITIISKQNVSNVALIFD